MKYQISMLEKEDFIEIVIAGEVGRTNVGTDAEWIFLGLPPM